MGVVESTKKSKKSEIESCVASFTVLWGVVVILWYVWFDWRVEICNLYRDLGFDGILIMIKRVWLIF